MLQSYYRHNEVCQVLLDIGYFNCRSHVGPFEFVGAGEVVWPITTGVTRAVLR